MSHNWKPGDVALVTMGDGAERIAMRDCDGSGWGLVGAPNHSRGLTVVSARPLVVIDPVSITGPDETLDADPASEIAKCLRRLAESDHQGTYRRRVAERLAARFEQSSKPNEPTGLGAIVEDTNGELWIRDKTTTTYKHWKRAAGQDKSRRYPWAEVAAVRIVRQGWHPEDES